MSPEKLAKIDEILHIKQELPYELAAELFTDYAYHLSRSKLLAALEAGGVDNWEGYRLAIQSLDEGSR